MTQLIVLSCLALILSTAFVTAGAHGKPSGSPVYRRLTRACAPTPGQILQPALIAARQTRWQAVGADEKRMIARRFPHSRSVSVVGTAGDLFATPATYLGFVRGWS
jgi:hypothetical protein